MNNKLSFLNKLIILIPLKFAFATILYFFVDQILGITIYVIAFVAIIWALILYNKTRNNIIINDEKQSAYFHMTIGIIILCIAGLILLVKGNSKLDIIKFKTIVGTFFLSIGLFKLYKFRKS